MANTPSRPSSTFPYGKTRKSVLGIRSHLQGQDVDSLYESLHGPGHSKVLGAIGTMPQANTNDARNVVQGAMKGNIPNVNYTSGQTQYSPVDETVYIDQDVHRRFPVATSVHEGSHAFQSGRGDVNTKSADRRLFGMQDRVSHELGPSILGLTAETEARRRGGSPTPEVNFEFPSGYSPRLEWMRQQAERFGLFDKQQSGNIDDLLEKNPQWLTAIAQKQAQSMEGMKPPTGGEIDSLFPQSQRDIEPQSMPPLNRQATQSRMTELNSSPESTLSDNQPSARRSDMPQPPPGTTLLTPAQRRQRMLGQQPQAPIGQVPQQATQQATQQAPPREGLDIAAADAVPMSPGNAELLASRSAGAAGGRTPFGSAVASPAGRTPFTPQTLQSEADAQFADVESSIAGYTARRDAARASGSTYEARTPSDPIPGYMAENAAEDGRIADVKSRMGERVDLARARTDAARSYQPIDPEQEMDAGIAEQRARRVRQDQMLGISTGQRPGGVTVHPMAVGTAGMGTGPSNTNYGGQGDKTNWYIDMANAREQGSGPNGGYRTLRDAKGEDFVPARDMTSYVSSGPASSYQDAKGNPINGLSPTQIEMGKQRREARAGVIQGRKDAVAARGEMKGMERRARMAGPTDEQRMMNMAASGNPYAMGMLGIRGENERAAMEAGSRRHGIDSTERVGMRAADVELEGIATRSEDSRYVTDAGLKGTEMTTQAQRDIARDNNQTSVSNTELTNRNNLDMANVRSGDLKYDTDAENKRHENDLNIKRQELDFAMSPEGRRQRLLESIDGSENPEAQDALSESIRPPGGESRPRFTPTEAPLPRGAEGLAGAELRDFLINSGIARTEVEKILKRTNPTATFDQPGGTGLMDFMDPDVQRRRIRNRQMPLIPGHFNHFQNWLGG